MRTVSIAYSGTPCARARICPRSVSGRPGANPSSTSLHRFAPQRLEVQRAEVALPRPPAGPAIVQLGPRHGDDEQRMVARPLEQVLDEVQQRGVGPLQILEREHDRVGAREALEEQSPGREQILAGARRLLRDRAAGQGGARRTRAPPRRADARPASPRAWLVPARGSSSSPIRQRILIMSASAQYVTPSPYARQRPRCHQTPSTSPSMYL